MPWLTGLQLAAVAGVIVVAALLQWIFKGADLLSLLLLIILFPLSIWIALMTDGGLKTLYSAGHYAIFKFNTVYNAVVGGSQSATKARFGLNVLYKKLVVISASVYIGFNFLLSFFYFPAILKYQPQNDFGRYAYELNRTSDLVCYQTIPDFALVFYARHLPPMIWSRAEFNKQLALNPNLLIFASADALKDLGNEHIPYKLLQERYSYPVSVPNGKFLNPASRNSVCQKVYLLDLSRH
jgi:hypothetical protein